MKTFAGEGGYFCCEIKPSDWGRDFAAELSLLKTEGLASLNRLEGALDAAGRLLESRRVDCFY